MKVVKLKNRINRKGDESIEKFQERVMEFRNSDSHRQLLYLAIGCVDFADWYRSSNHHLISTERDTKNQRYGFIPSRPPMIVDFYYAIRSLEMTITDKIVDVGCGFSPILMFLKTMRYTQLTGLEIQSKIIKDCELFTLGRMIETNVLKYDDYSQFKAIYTYCPLLKDQDKLIKRICKQMQPGAILFESYGYALYQDQYEELGMKQLGMSTSIKMK